MEKTCPDAAITHEWADLRNLQKPPHTLVKRITAAIGYYPCDILFIHRDAESQPAEQRHNEINDAVNQTKQVISKSLSVHVVPVRMTETWLLGNEIAIRKAAGNPNGISDIQLPPLEKLENVVNPKQTLYRILKNASGRTGRHLKKFSPEKKCHLIAHFIDSFEHLKVLPAFRKFMEDTAIACSSLFYEKDTV